jgi:adenylate kinase family enzyme
MRIAIVGTSGSGKSTLAKKLADILSCPHIEVDTIGWLPNWTKKPDDQFIQDVTDATSKSKWVACGNWSLVQDIIWTRATHLVWIKLPFRIVFWRLFKRTMKNILTKRTIANGNQETIYQQFFTKQSIFLWAYQTHWKRQKTYPPLISSYKHLSVITLTSQKQIDEFVQTVLD